MCCWRGGSPRTSGCCGLFMLPQTRKWSTRSNTPYKSAVGGKENTNISCRHKHPVKIIFHRMFRCLQLRKRKNYDYPDFQLPSANELKSVEESIVTGGRGPGPYENTATLDHRDIARRAQQEQDKIGRYARDPTGKKVRSHLCYLLNEMSFFHY